MIPHDRAQALLSERLEGPLAPADARDLQAHLAACVDCRRFADDLERLALGMRALPQLPPSPAVSRAVLEAVADRPPAWAWLRRGFGLVGSPGMAVASGLALVVALAGTLYLATNPDPGEVEPRATLAAVAIAPEVSPTPTAAPTTIPAPAPPTLPPNPTATATSMPPTAVPTATRTINVRVTPTVPPTAVPTVAPEPAAPVPTEAPILAMAGTTVESAPAPGNATTPQSPIEAVPAIRREGRDRGRDDRAGAIEAAQEIPADSAAEPTAGPAPAAIEPGDVVGAGADDGGALPAGDVLAMGPIEAAAPASAEVDATPSPPAVDHGGAGSDQDAEQPTAPMEPTSTPTPEPAITAAVGLPPDDGGLPPIVESPVVEPTSPPIVPVDGAPVVTDNDAGADGVWPTIAPVDTQPQIVPPAELGDPALVIAPVVPVAPVEVDPTAITEAAVEIIGEPIVDAVDPSAGDTVPVPPVVDPIAMEPTVPPVDEPPGEDWTGTAADEESVPAPIAGAGEMSVEEVPPAPAAPADAAAAAGVAPGADLVVAPDPATGSATISAWNPGVGGSVPLDPTVDAHTDVPIGWFGGSVWYQRRFADGRVELRSATPGGGGYPLWSGTDGGPFGSAFQSGLVSPGGDRIAYLSGGALYVAPTADPNAAAALPVGPIVGYDWSPGGDRLAVSDGFGVSIFSAFGEGPLITVGNPGGIQIAGVDWSDAGLGVVNALTGEIVRVDI